MVRDVPLRGFRKIVVADLLEIALLPEAAVDEGNVVLGKGYKRVRPGEVRRNRLRVLARVANDICHWSRLPAIIDVRVARLAFGRSNIVSIRLGTALSSNR